MTGLSRRSHHGSKAFADATVVTHGQTSLGDQMSPRVRNPPRSLEQCPWLWVQWSIDVCFVQLFSEMVGLETDEIS